MTKIQLREGCSTIIAKCNYSKLISEGYPLNQSYIISLKEARKSINLCDVDRREALRRGQLFQKKPK